MRLRWSVRDVKKVRPYEKLASIYDHLMSHVDYQFWAEYTHDLIQRWHPQVQTLLDIACGTGNLLKEMNEFSYKLFGCDFSFPMVLQAAKKPSLWNVSLWQSDMVHPAFKRRMDVILCLYDSINYIMKEEKIAQFLITTNALLSPQGILIFDICTERNSLNYFYNYYDHDENEKFSYDRWSHYNQKKKIQFTEFKIRIKNNPVTYHEVHEQRIYPISIFLRLIKSSPLKILSVYDEFSFDQPQNKSNRIHFVLQRREF